MGYLSCNAESAISTCDTYNWNLSKKPTNNPQSEHFKVKNFTFSDLEAATNAFSQSNFLGKGSHGSVYKATLNNGTYIAAVKKTTTHHHVSDNNNTNNPAENEIETLSRVRSPRLVNLLGFGVDSNGRKLIVVEFMPNGSLYDLLHGVNKPPGWARRVRIMLHVAKAVQHLHCSNPPVIHRDIKSSNVLMDGNWNARLGDFGLALRGHVEDVKVRCTPPAGTLGYLDPGYLAPGDLSTKSDVFSFGILMLEIISGRKAIDMNNSPPSVVDWATALIRSGRYAEIFDRRIASPAESAVVRQLVVLAARCVRSTAKKRPAMVEVAECLREIRKRVTSPVWNGLGRRRVGRTSPLTEYEGSGEASELIKASKVAGSRRNRKVSNVSSVELKIDALNERLTKSKSIGSIHEEIRFGPLDANIGRRRAGLAVRMPMVRLSKSRSTGVVQGKGLVNNNGNKGNLVVRIRNPNGKEMEESKLLVVNSLKVPSLKL